MQLLKIIVGVASENETENTQELQRLKHFLVFTLFGVPTMIVFGVYNFFAGNMGLVFAIAISATSVVAGSFMQMRYPGTMIIYRICAITYCLLLLYMFALGGEGGSKALWLYTFPLVAFFILGKREGAGWVLALLVFLTALYSGLFPYISVYPYSKDFFIRLILVYLIISGISAWFEYFRSIYYLQLQQGNQRFQEILKNSRDILYRRNISTGKYEYISDAFFDQLGYSRSEMFSSGYNDISSLIHPDDRHKHENYIASSMQNPALEGVDHNVEYRMKHSDGSYYWFSDKISLVRNKEGKPDHIIGINREISHLRNTRLALEQSREQLVTILNSLDAHIYVADLHSHEILFMNYKMKEDFGDDLEGKVCWREFRKAEEPCAHCSNARLLDDNQQPTGLYEWECHNPILGRWYYNYDRAIRWIDGRWVRLQIAIDVTRNREIEEQKKKLDETIRRANHLESIGSLAGGIAHDFNNLLQVTDGYLGLIKDDETLSRQTIEKIGKIFEATAKAKELTNRLITLSPGGKPYRRKVNIAEVLRQVVSEEVRNEKIQCEVFIASDLCPARVDLNQLKTALKSLLKNSCESIAGAGSITVSAANHVEEKDVKERDVVIAAGSYISIVIKDTGCGIAPAQTSRIFDPYYTTKEMGVAKGVGLGLSVVYSIISQHDGFIRVDSTEGKGTAVTIYLPADAG